MEEEKSFLENKFVDYFQMSIDQFDDLDLETQEELIKKALILRKKVKKLESKLNSKKRFSEVISGFTKDLKRK